MTITEAASVYMVSEGALYRLLRQGRLTRYRRGADRRTYLSIEELDRELRPRPEER
jgi:excisionase family DNA binding protein